MNVRLAAAKIIATVLRSKASLATLLPEYQTKVDDKDQSLLQELCFGTCRWSLQLDYQLNQLLEKPFQPKDSDLRANLLCALYQIQHMRIPDYAAINDAVENTKRLKKSWASKLSNGVLRNFLRQQEELIAKAQQQDSTRLSHPNWLLKRWKNQWPKHWQAIAEANNQHPPFTLRINPQHSSREDYIEQLSAANIEAQASAFSEHGITLKQAADVLSLPLFAEGGISVQDEAAQLAAPLLELEAGQHVLDACCAPGGKTGHILESADNISVIALDMEAKRLERVEENLSRLQSKNPNQSVELVCADAAKPDEWWDGRHFDRILLDAPCSATGVIRRHPDIKLLRTPADIDKLALLQREILDALWSLLKPGGILVYATCSVMQEENTQVVEHFIAQTDDASCDSLDVEWGIAQACGRQLFPQPAGHDGFYYARLRKAG